MKKILSIIIVGLFITGGAMATGLDLSWIDKKQEIKADKLKENLQYINGRVDTVANQVNQTKNALNSLRSEVNSLKSKVNSL